MFFIVNIKLFRNIARKKYNPLPIIISLAFWTCLRSISLCCYEERHTTERKQYSALNKKILLSAPFKNIKQPKYQRAKSPVVARRARAFRIPFLSRKRVADCHNCRVCAMGVYKNVHNRAQAI